ncbi:DUF1211 domain-containing protein [Lactobacillus sp. PV037]|uniref:TMEM175 family protein n=1 Tax=Lactobacillus sp. PV037 TaxID=2594496 RepID=UPI00223EDA29|nr:TMEM175 family protein [Lactobacillus sp. PV037]QNQ83217.1 DUF1211 domain-containing protein [Lactobacillus sp. PV037]
MPKSGKFKITPEEKEKLLNAKSKITEDKSQAPKRLKEHLQALNDAVLAIVMTIIVLEIQPPVHVNEYGDFLKDIGVFLITFFILGEFWYSLHKMFDYLGFKPDKLTVIFDLGLLADLSILPAMTKWIMATPSTFAVINFGVVFLIAQIFSILVRFFGTKPLLESSIMEKMNYRHALVRLEITAIMSIILIAVAWWYPSLAMVLYLSIPIVSFFFPKRNKKIR